MSSLSENPLVSVIVPVYRNEKYLNKCVDSILAQTYTNLDVVLVDDGSPDRCGAMCDEYAAQDKRVQVIHQENAGVSAARNAALDAARGEYAAFVDSDDYVMPCYIEVMLRNLLESDADQSTCAMDNKRHFDQECVVFDFERDEKAAYKSFFKICGSGHFQASACCSIYRTSIIREHNIRFPNGIRISEDVIFNLRYLPYVRRMAASPDVLYVVVPSDTSVTRTVLGKKDTFRDMENVMVLYEECLKNCHTALSKTVVRHYLWDCAWQLVSEGEKFAHDAEKYRKMLARDIIPYLVWKKNLGWKCCLKRFIRVCMPPRSIDKASGIV